MATASQMLSSVAASTSVLVVAYVFLLERVTEMKEQADTTFWYDLLSYAICIAIAVGGISILFGAILLITSQDIVITSLENMEPEPTYDALMAITFALQGVVLSTGAFLLQKQEVK